MNKEDPKSGFSKERFLRAVNASKVKLNQVIQYRQEREAEINSASEPVARLSVLSHSYPFFCQFFKKTKTQKRG